MAKWSGINAWVARQRYNNNQVYSALGAIEKSIYENCEQRQQCLWNESYLVELYGQLNVDAAVDLIIGQGFIVEYTERDGIKYASISWREKNE